VTLTPWVVLGATALAVLPWLPLCTVHRPALRLARDRVFRAALVVAGAGVANLEPALLPAWAYLVWTWRGPSARPDLERWAAVLGLVALARLLPDAALTVVVGLWIVPAIYLSLAPGTSRWLGQRTVAAAAFTVVAALASSTPVVAALLLPGLVRTCSWAAGLAVAVALPVRWPWLLPWEGLTALALAELAWALPTRRWLDRWSPRGSSLDSVRQRVTALRFTWATASWRGLGPGGVSDAYARWAARVRPASAESLGHVHCEPAQLVLEYGALGGLLVLAVAWRLATSLVLGDPWSAAAVAGLVLAGTTPAMRWPPTALIIGTVWARVTA